MTRIECDVAIIGAGTAGLYALRAVRRAGASFVLIDHGPLGTTCARVGCMPSKVALHMGAQWQAAQKLAVLGGSGMEQLSLDRAAAWSWLRRQRDAFSGSAEGKAREAAGKHLLEGRARFVASDRLLVLLNSGAEREVCAKAIIVATGSHAVVPSWLDGLRGRVITTDELFELETVPDSVGILGLGAIGLEMGLALARLGVQVTGADIANTIGGMSDPEVAARAIDRFRSEMQIWLQAPAQLSADGSGVLMQTDDGRRTKVDMVLAALGRRPNLDGQCFAEAGVELDTRGVPPFDPHTLQIGQMPIFLAGDANADRSLMHEAAHEGDIAGRNAALLAQNPDAQAEAYGRATPLSIAFSNPDLASVGARLNSLDSQQIVIGSAEGQANGRLRILGEHSGLLRVYADKSTGRLLGAGMLAAGGEHLAHLLAWSIGRGETAGELLQMPFYHPVVEELVQSAMLDIVRQVGHQAPARTDSARV